MADESLVHESRIAVPYKWSAGLTGSRFLKTAAAEHKFLGSRCGACKRISVPPLKACGRCLRDCEQGVEVGPGGTLMSFTQAAPAGRPSERRLFALIRLDGADTDILHVLEGASLPALKTGLRVKPVFADDPQAGVLAVLHFRPSKD